MGNLRWSRDGSCWIGRVEEIRAASYQSMMTYEIVDLRDIRSEYQPSSACFKKSHNNIAGPNVVRKFRISHVSRIQGPIVSDGCQKRLVDIVGWAEEAMSVTNQPGVTRNWICTIRGIVDEETIISHVVIHNRPESRVKGSSLTD